MEQSGSSEVHSSSDGQAISRFYMEAEFVSVYNNLLLDPILSAKIRILFFLNSY
jgi:hypothetical protein